MGSLPHNKQVPVTERKAISLTPSLSRELSLFFFLCFLHFSGFDACVGISEYVTSSERGPVALYSYVGVVLAVLWGLFIAVGFFTSGAAGLCLEVVLSRRSSCSLLWLR